MIVLARTTVSQHSPLGYNCTAKKHTNKNKSTFPRMKRDVWRDGSAKKI